MLHPPQLAGAALRVTHSDGSTEESSFPRGDQPAPAGASTSPQLAWLHAGSEVSVAFEGDVFEMEDQRNWSDASYKTYSRPLAIPFPYAIAAGERVRQSVQIDVREVAASGADADARPRRASRVGGPVFELGARRRDGARPRAGRRRADPGRGARRARPAHTELAAPRSTARRRRARRSTCA